MTGTKLRAYYWLTKPGIIYGNLMTTGAAFLLASSGDIDWLLLVATLAGTGLIIASACVFNNYIDRGIDQRMNRTKWRAGTLQEVGERNALVYGSVLGATGFAVLTAWTNGLVVAIGLFALLDYVIFYGLAKRRIAHGTLVGSVAGAAPPLAGYVAVTGEFDGGAWLVFLILTCWQMAHFYAIAIYRLKDYKAAGIPVLPAIQGVESAKQQIYLYIVAFLLASVTLTVSGYAGYLFLTGIVAVVAAWLYIGLKQGKKLADGPWAKQMFLVSLLVLTGLSFLWSIDGFLPGRV